MSVAILSDHRFLQFSLQHLEAPATIAWEDGTASSSAAAVEAIEQVPADQAAFRGDVPPSPFVAVWQKSLLLYRLALPDANYFFRACGMSRYPLDSLQSNPRCTSFQSRPAEIPSIVHKSHQLVFYLRRLTKYKSHQQNNNHAMPSVKGLLLEWIMIVFIVSFCAQCPSRSPPPHGATCIQHAMLLL